MHNNPQHQSNDKETRSGKSSDRSFSKDGQGKPQSGGGDTRNSGAQGAGPSQQDHSKPNQQSGNAAKTPDHKEEMLRADHPFRDSIPEFFVNMTSRDALKNLFELDALSKDLSRPYGCLNADENEGALSTIASALLRTMPRYSAAQMAHIAEKYQEMNFFDAAVFERIAFEIDLGGPELGVKPRDLVKILSAAAHLRADKYLDQERYDVSIKPLVRNLVSLMPQTLSKNNCPLSMPEMVSAARALVILSPDDAATFAKFAMIKSNNNPSLGAAQDLLEVFLADSASAGMEIQASRCLSLLKLNASQVAAVDTIKEVLNAQNYQCQVINSRKLLGSDNLMVADLVVTDPISNLTHNIHLNTGVPMPCQITNWQGDLALSGGGELRKRAFAPDSPLASLVSKTSSPLVLNLSPHLVAYLAASPDSLERRYAVDVVTPRLVELFLRSEESQTARASA